MDAINQAPGSGVAVQISRFVRSTDSLMTYAGLDTDGPNDFDLVPAEGYQVVVSGGDITYSMEGSHADDFQVAFYGAGETLPEGGTSNTGLNDYAPPYNRIAEKASDFMEELNGIGCPGGSCSSGVCSGGARDGQDCTPFVSISRFIISTDGFLTYAGGVSDLPNDFDLVAGESYRVQVTDGVSFVPAEYDFDVDVEIENRPPAPCGGPYDGGLVRLRNNNSDYVKLQWHGGDPSFEDPPDATPTNLVFLPDDGPESCGTVNYPPVTETQGCAVTCPGPQLSQPGGCEVMDCDTCGCEIFGNVGFGYCDKLHYTTFILCEDDADCEAIDPELGCKREGPLGPEGEPEAQRVHFCNQTGCARDPHFPECVGTCCGDPHYYPEDTNCCDQPDVPGQCDDPALIQCVVIEPGYRFSVVARSDDDSVWVDLGDRGIVPSVTETNCCEFVCGGVLGTGIPCTTDGDCDAPETCESPCDIGGIGQ